MRIKHNSIIWYPLVISIAIVLGIVIGNYISTKKFTLDKDRKINAVLNLIQSEYVDSIDVKDLVEQAIPAIIGNLDPHSYYIPASDIRAENEKLDGSMSGIGVSFFMMNDTANVDQVIPNGPAEKVGMLAGDRIISVNGESIVGGTLTAEGIRSKIRGEKGTKVKIGVKRNSSKKTLTFTITRDDIPMNTIDVSYMLDDKTGYIKIAQFGKNTYDEFFAALSKLKKDGASRYIVDLRGNPGGYMEMAILMVNEFLEQGELIVYTKGRKEREDIQVWSDDQGSFHDAQVAVLIDEYSASASEIMAGALQDNDRGLVVGRRSFGKGLVQKQIYLPDSSAIRLTIARYYTPSHRCIQKDYTLGDEDDYSKELYDRYSHGELYSADSIKVDKSKIFRTANGRIVYGGGGIVPDIFVPNDTTGITTYYRAVANLGLLQQYVYTYVDINRDQLKNVKTVKQLMGMMPSDDALTYDFVCYARDNGVPMRWYYINLSRAVSTPAACPRDSRRARLRRVLPLLQPHRQYSQRRLESAQRRQGQVSNHSDKHQEKERETVMATKTDIRRDIRQLKRMLTDEQKAIAASKCFSRLEQFQEFIDADRILVYASLPDEISTDEFISRWYGRKQIFLPRVNGDDLDILPYRPGDTAEGAFGIDEPTGNECRDISEIDLVVVPAMAFDRRGNRLGRGRGFYDRLLHNATCPLIGAAYAIQIVEHIPAEPHDIKIPTIVTDEETIRIQQYGISNS